MPFPWKVVGIASAVVVAVAVGALLFWEPDLSRYERYVTAQREHLPTTRVLTVTLVGDPDVTAPKAAALLFGKYFSLTNNSAAQSYPLPPIRARWPLPLSTPRAQWVGRYAIAVGPDTVLPGAAAPATVAVAASDADGNESLAAIAAAGAAEEALGVRVQDWAYGDYAQVLHTGPYADEQPTVAALKERVQQLTHGTKRVLPASHEEEYLRASGAVVSVDPKRYKTLIRYALVDADATADTKVDADALHTGAAAAAGAGAGAKANK